MAKIRIPKLGRGLDFLTKEATKSTDGYFKLLTAENIMEEINTRQLEYTQNRPKRKRKSNISRPKESSKASMPDAKIADSEGTTSQKKFDSSKKQLGKIPKAKRDIKALHSQIKELKKKALNESYKKDLGRDLTNEELNALLKDSYKNDSTGKEIKALGTTWVKDKKTGLPKQVRTNSLDRKKEQLERVLQNPSSHSERTVKQHISAQNVVDYYGYDIWQFIKEEGIPADEYNISEDWYIDQKTGERKRLSLVYWDGIKWIKP